MTNIAILVPVCSRNESYSSFEDIPFLKLLLPSIEKTKSEGFNYTFFIGYDDDDLFYKENRKNLEKYGKVFELSGCQHAPAYAWNALADFAYNDTVSFDYFFQIGDDVTMVTPGWTEVFISKLSGNKNIGVVGPCNFQNYNARLESNKHIVIENSFVHRSHLDIFGSFFHKNIPNWFCDDWLTLVYNDSLSECITSIECINRWITPRYKITQCPDLYTYVKDGKTTLHYHI